MRVRPGLAVLRGSGRGGWFRPARFSAVRKRAGTFSGEVILSEKEPDRNMAGLVMQQMLMQRSGRVLMRETLRVCAACEGAMCGRVLLLSKVILGRKETLRVWAQGGVLARGQTCQVFNDTQQCWNLLRGGGPLGEGAG